MISRSAFAALFMIAPTSSVYAMTLECPGGSKVEGKALSDGAYSVECPDGIAITRYRFIISDKIVKADKNVGPKNGTTTRTVVGPPKNGTTTRTVVGSKDGRITAVARPRTYSGNSRLLSQDYDKNRSRNEYLHKMLDPVCQALAADIVTSKSGLVTFDSSVTEKGLTINARYEVGEDSYMQTVEIPPAKLREGGFFINSELWPYLYDGGEGKEEKIELADIEDTLLVTYNAADAKLRGAEAADRAKAVTSGLGEN